MNDKDKSTGLYFSAFCAFAWAGIEYKYLHSIGEELKKNITQPVVLENANEGKPVYITGRLTAKGDLQDPEFNIKKECLRLTRTVFKYSKDWAADSTSVIKSWEKSLPGPYSLTPFLISPEVLSHISTSFPISLSMVPKFSKENYKKKGFAVYFSPESFFISKYLRKSNIYSPVQGDFKVSYTYIPNQLYISVIGEQCKGEIIPYRGRIFIVKEGYKSLPEMLSLIPEEKKTFLYTARLCCSFGVLCGLYLKFLNSK